MNDTVTVLTALAVLAVGSGGGGIVGALVMLRRFRMEQAASETQSRVSLQAVDVEQFKALFPGGLGDAVEHWREEAKEVYKEVDRLREIERINYDEILILRTELDRTKTELSRTKRDLERANRRIGQLESERGTTDERSHERPEDALGDGAAAEE